VAQPILTLLEPDEVVEIEESPGEWTSWKPRADFSESGHQDRHFVCDPLARQVRFGLAIRQPDGTVSQKGMIPPQGARIRMPRYRSGGGTKGNVGPRTLTVLKSPIPYVDRVTNRDAAHGGTDKESLEHAKLRGVREWRTRNRAVTTEDFETLAREASSAVARAKCLQARPGQEDPPPGTVRLLLVPTRAKNVDRPSHKDLTLPKWLEEEVDGYFYNRRLLCTNLEIRVPTYRWVYVQVSIKVQERSERRVVEKQVEDALYNFLHPLRGGLEETGWPFGRDLYIADIYNVVQKVPGVHSITDARIRETHPDTEEPSEGGEQIELEEYELVASSYIHPHHVDVVEN
jgi:predicted phage baseplate assembly protein